MIQNTNTRTIAEKSNVKDKYTQLALKQLLEMDVIRRRKFKNSFEYMVNPAYFTRATLRASFTLIEWYIQMPCESKDVDEFTDFFNE